MIAESGGMSDKGGWYEWHTRELILEYVSFQAIPGAYED